MTTYTAAQAIAAANAGTPLSGASILDSAADIQAAINALQPLAAANEISAINFNDASSPTVDVTTAQYNADLTAINMFQGARTLLVTDATVGVAFTLQSQQHIAFDVVDTGSAIESNIDALSNIANEIRGITITDGTIPSFSASQLVNDSAVIGGITVAGIDASKAVANANSVLNIHGLEVSDTAANISSNIDGLEVLAATGKLTSVTLTDGGIPTIDLSPAQLTADGSAIGTIQSPFILVVDGTDANLTLNGPNGVANELVLDGTSNEYSFAGTGDGKSFTITETATGRESTDHLSNFDAIQFNNGGGTAPTLAFVASDTPTTAGAVSSAAVASLYAAVLDRAPDVAGLAYYENEANSNPSMTITRIATQFLTSPEYTGNTAHNYAQSTAGENQFITDTYNNLLHRGPEAGAVSWYETNEINPILANLTPGTAAYAAADVAAHALVLASFSESAEFRADVTVTAQNPASASHWLVLI
jgi:hypothetical protein